MNTNPLISIVLPVYNGEKYLKQSIESIIAQSFAKWELIIVDDCSTDNSAAIMERFSSEDDRIRIIHNETNQKLPQSLNIGFENAKGRYFTWTSDDNVYYPTALMEMYDYLNNNPNLPMVTADMDVIDNRGSVISKWNSFDQEELCYRNGIGACFLYRADVINTIGKYNTSLFLVEDYDYWLRILFSYKEIAHINRSLYGFRVHEGSLSECKGEAVKKKLYLLRLSYLADMLMMLEPREDLIVRMYCEMVEIGGLSVANKELFKNHSRVIRSFSDYNYEKNTVIYGAGNYGVKVSPLINNPILFVDRNEGIVGKTINGIEVVSIDDLKHRTDEYQLLIALHHDKLYSAISFLMEEGFDQFCIIQDFLRFIDMDYDRFNSKTELI